MDADADVQVRRFRNQELLKSSKSTNCQIDRSSTERSRTYAETNLGVLPKGAQAPKYMQWGEADYAKLARAIVNHAANCMRNQES